MSVHEDTFKVKSSHQQPDPSEKSSYLNLNQFKLKSDVEVPSVDQNSKFLTEPMLMNSIGAYNSQKPTNSQPKSSEITNREY